MKGGTTKSLGFTIIETLIVLAITSGMFVAAAVYVSGRQNKVMFTDAIQDVRSRILQISNDVSAGYYPNAGNFSCSVSGGNISISSTPRAQGENSDCTFLGKSIVFGVDGNNEAYRVENLIGKRVGSNGEPVDLADAGVAVLSPDGSNGWPETAEKGKLKNGLSVVWMKQLVPFDAKSNRLNNMPVIGVSVVTSAYGQIASDSQGFLQSGTIVPSLVGITAKTNDATQSQLPANITANPGVTAQEGNRLITAGLRNGNIVIHNPEGGIQLCFASGTTDQSGLVKIGGNNRVFTVDVDIKTGKTCA